MACRRFFSRIKHRINLHVPTASMVRRGTLTHACAASQSEQQGLQQLHHVLRRRWAVRLDHGRSSRRRLADCDLQAGALSEAHGGEPNGREESSGRGRGHRGCHAAPRHTCTSTCAPLPAAWAWNRKRRGGAEPSRGVAKLATLAWPMCAVKSCAGMRPRGGGSALPQHQSQLTRHRHMHVHTCPPPLP